MQRKGVLFAVRYLMVLCQELLMSIHSAAMTNRRIVVLAQGGRPRVTEHGAWREAMVKNDFFEISVTLLRPTAFK